MNFLLLFKLYSAFINIKSFKKIKMKLPITLLLFMRLFKDNGLNKTYLYNLIYIIIYIINHYLCKKLLHAKNSYLHVNLRINTFLILKKGWLANCDKI